MKNLMKYLGVFAIAGSLGLQTMNVSAAETTCEEGKVLHTNYYLFLGVNDASYYSGLTDGTVDHIQNFNGADKYLNIKGVSAAKHGSISITDGTRSTVASTSEDTVEWSVVDFWKKYYNAMINRDENEVYNSDENTTYLTHKEWWTYETSDFTGGTLNTTESENVSVLLTYLKNNLRYLSSSSLVTDGTLLPRTSIKAPISDLGIDTTETTLRWYVDRYTDADAISGVSGAQLTTSSSSVIYSPAAYFVEFCVDAPAEAKTVTYDANATDAVTNVPNTDSFTEECTEISDKTPVREGYTFLGWSTDETATTADSKYAPGSEYCGDSIVLHAVWQATNATGNYTINYDANGGKDAPASQTDKVGSCQTISSSKPTLEGNNFLGWSTDKNAKEPDSKYAAGQQYCGDNGDVTLYAVWQPQTGVSAHAIAFTIVAVAAGAALVVAKKKDLFRQI